MMKFSKKIGANLRQNQLNFSANWSVNLEQTRSNLGRNLGAMFGAVLISGCAMFGGENLLSQREFSGSSVKILVREYTDRLILKRGDKSYELRKNGDYFMGENIIFGFRENVAVLNENGVENVFIKE